VWNRLRFYKPKPIHERTEVPDVPTHNNIRYLLLSFANSLHPQNPNPILLPTAPMSSSLLTTLGLRAAGADPLHPPPPSLAASYILWQFVFAYGILSSRTLKKIYGIDHQVSPREDLVKYGPKAVESGKITQKQLNQLKRMEAASANSVEHFPFFVGALIWAHVAGLSTTEINRSGLIYVLARIGYGVVYVLAERPRVALWWGVMWWVGNIVCARLFWIGGNAMNSRL
jgi:uncharacterized MAPEG superfamily protein